MGKIRQFKAIPIFLLSEKKQTSDLHFLTFYFPRCYREKSVAGKFVELKIPKIKKAKWES